jgi:anti-sigma regulatory factor (Ser/Thr protein kinase)
VRHEVRNYFSSYTDDGSLNAIEVIASALLTNVVRHTDSGARIFVDWPDDAPTLTVTDAGPGYEVDDDSIDFPGVDADHGFGLWLVSQLADGVRITRGPRGGTTVTVKLRCGLRFRPTESRKEQEAGWRRRGSSAATHLPSGSAESPCGDTRIALESFDAEEGPAGRCPCPARG